MSESPLLIGHQDSFAVAAKVSSPPFLPKQAACSELSLDHLRTFTGLHPSTPVAFSSVQIGIEFEFSWSEDHFTSMYNIGYFKCQTSAFPTAI